MSENPSESLVRFEEIYRNANGEDAGVPWADKAPRGRLAAWLAGQPGTGRLAIDVGCGLGDNAALLAGAGYKVTAFDLSKTAIVWAKRRHAGRGIDFHTADLFQVPADWQGTFALVHETYNLQALPLELRAGATRAIAALLAPDGQLLVLARLRDEGETVAGPPIPVTRAELRGFEAAGLLDEGWEEFADERQIRHVQAVYKKPA
jgi:SAM-dependent methyltransferase